MGVGAMPTTVKALSSHQSRKCYGLLHDINFDKVRRGMPIPNYTPLSLENFQLMEEIYSELKMPSYPALVASPITEVYRPE